jgi:hypothetical protein
MIRPNRSGPRQQEPYGSRPGPDACMYARGIQLDSMALRHNFFSNKTRSRRCRKRSTDSTQQPEIQATKEHDRKILIFGLRTSLQDRAAHHA